jgi:1-acyl-sn-glycerol-3-phosphate acyltransferase
MMTGDFPKYGIPSGVVVGLAFNALFGLKRSFRSDALRCIRRLKPSLRVIGKENVPDHGPCVVMVNHYYRPGFGAWWIALAVAATVPVEMHWVVTGELLYLGRLGSPISRWALARIGKTYDFTTMPPMPPRPQDMEARAKAVKKVLKLVKQSGNTVLGLAPEGADQQGGRLSLPPSGVGRFALLLADLGCAFVPVGAYEADGAFCLHFGPAYQLEAPSGLSPDGKDHAAAEVVMKNIAALLPEALRGEFA